MSDYVRYDVDTPFGHKRTDSPRWMPLGDSIQRFESRPPDGVRLTRVQKQAFLVVEFAKTQIEHRSYGGHRHG